MVSKRKVERIILTERQEKILRKYTNKRDVSIQDKGRIDIVLLDSEGKSYKAITRILNRKYNTVGSRSKFVESQIIAQNSKSHIFKIRNTKRNSLEISNDIIEPFSYSIRNRENSVIDNSLLRHLTVKYKKLDIETEYFKEKDINEKKK